MGIRNAMEINARNDAKRETALEARATAAESRLREIEAGGEPVAWIAKSGACSKLKWTEQGAKDWFKCGTIEPLYRHPPKAAETAIGVTEERFAVLEDLGRWFLPVNGAFELGSRETAEEVACTDDRILVRIVAADAPTVDVAEVRAIASGLVKEHFYDAANRLRAAIGEKAGS